MRGAPSVTGHEGGQDGIIPADAGSTRIRLLVWMYRPDHPRGCGEHDHPGPDSGRRTGSSPRMRGALKNSDSGHVRERIIPADAGSTRCP